MKQKILFLLSMFVMCITALGQTPVQPSGSGTEDDPYQVGTLEELLWFNTDDIWWNTTDGCHIVLTNDIDMSPYCHPADEENGIEEVSWEPILRKSKYTTYSYFYGTFDGQNHSIKNLYINRTFDNFENGYPYAGLFYYTDNKACIKNLKLENVNIHVESNVTRYYLNVGAIVGCNMGIIENCHVSGTIFAKYLNNYEYHHTEVGGIVGHNSGSVTGKSGGVIKNSTNDADVSGYGVYVYSGGICGYGYRNSNNSYRPEYKGITRCVNNGKIKSQGSNDCYSGGIAGLLQYSNTVSDCINTGTIQGGIAGGIIGYNSIPEANVISEIISCYNKGSVIATKKVGHIVGSSYFTTVYGYTYTAKTWVVSPTAQTYLDGVMIDVPTDSIYIKATNAQLKSGAIAFALQDSRDILYWKQKLGVDNEPVLNYDDDSWEGLVVADETIDCRGVHTKVSDNYKNALSYSQTMIPHQYVEDYCTVCGHYIEPQYVSGYYIIKSTGNLMWFRDKFNNSYTDLKTENLEFAANIDMSVVKDYTPNGWIAIGGASPYTGTVKGNGNSIKNFYYNKTNDTDHNGGLFKTMFGANISDLKILGNSTCASSGLLAYSAGNCTLEKCFVKGTLNCSAEAAGGLLANASNSNLDYCASYVDITGKSAVGGLIGKSSSAAGNSLFYSASYGTLKGTSNVGGLIGSSNEDGITNSVCYAPHASGFEGCYYTADGTKVTQTQTQMNDGTTLTAMNDNNWFQDPADVAPVLGSIEGYKHYQVNCLGHEIIDPLLAYFTRDDSEVRYYSSEGHHYYVDGFCECTRTPDGYIHHYVNCQSEDILSDDAKYLTNNKEEAPRLYNGDGHYYVDGTCVCTRTPDGYIHHYVNCQGEEINEDFAKYFTNNKVEDPCLYKGDGHHYVNGFCEYCSLIEQDEDGYYLFSHASQFVWLRENIATVGTNFKIRQIADIDMSEFCHPADAAKGVAEVNWIPIVGSTELAYGIYDGQGHTISGLYCNAGSTISYASLFGVVGYHGAAPGGEKDWPSVVKNLTIEGNIISHRDAAIFAGNSFYATFENCTSRGSVTLDGSYTPEPYGGGIVGKSYTTLFNYCQNDADVESKAWLKSASVGGIAGHGGIFSYCVNTGRISAIGGSLGGITGSPDVKLPNGTAPDCSLYNCGNSGDVCGVSKSGYTSNPGALVGLVLSALPKAKNCWANCTVSNDKTDTGGSVVTANDFYVKGSSIRNKLSVTNSYYNSETGMTSTATSKTTAQFASGEVTYLLGSPWGQNITDEPKDLVPVLGGRTVDYDGTTYFNVDDASIAALAKLIEKLNAGEATKADVDNMVNKILGK